ncbi:Glutaredoxin-like domain [Modicisalibacter muralis]|uniref:Glutaredoxin-like domain n=1 Tax=Modicisalibacter muralis TaxID=119000 RepID=A0A1G9F2N1_9GAMM|nr:glutaredoxin family protein [Halomonas muralis]SDK82627.1 Glutaredoxin-like domain [Halomonas muralis]
MNRLRLYTTLGCHLCERLEAKLARLGVAGIKLERIDIADDEALVARYGERIPVLADSDGQELERGFEVERLAAWLDARGLLAAPLNEVQEVDSPPRGARRVRGRRFLN